MGDNLFINQIIYVRKKPELRTYDYDAMNSALKAMLGDSLEDNNLSGLLGNYIGSKSGVKQEYDLSSLDRFYVLSIKDGKYHMKPVSMVIDMPAKTYDNIQEINEEFVSLLDVINQGEYVGKKLKRTKPLSAISIGGSIDEYEPIVLYKYEDIMIGLFNHDTDDKNYQIVSKLYVDDNNWTLEDKVYEDYDSKQMVFNSVLRKVKQNLNSEKLF